MSIPTVTIPAEEKARRYRRKLSDLVQKIKAWHAEPNFETHLALVEEMLVVKSQLETEERLQNLQATAPEQEGEGEKAE